MDRMADMLAVVAEMTGIIEQTRGFQTAELVFSASVANLTVRAIEQRLEEEGLSEEAIGSITDALHASMRAITRSMARAVQCDNAGEVNDFVIDTLGAANSVQDRPDWIN